MNTHLHPLRMLGAATLMMAAPAAMAASAVDIDDVGYDPYLHVASFLEADCVDLGIEVYGETVACLEPVIAVVDASFFTIDEEGEDSEAAE